MPPLGDLAFALPKKLSADDYKTVIFFKIIYYFFQVMVNRQFNTFGNYCPQIKQSYINNYNYWGMNMSQDCLSLNVFTSVSNDTVSF